jgi:DNA-binding NarL/FixJ family response regulator
MPQPRDSSSRAQQRRQEEARQLARQGKNGADIARRLQVSPRTVRRWADAELQAYRKSQQARARQLALKGKSAKEISRQMNVSERTVYQWAQNQLKTAVYQARRKRWGKKP